MIAISIFSICIGIQECFQVNLAMMETDQSRTRKSEQIRVHIFSSIIVIVFSKSSNCRKQEVIYTRLAEKMFKVSFDDDDFEPVFKDSVVLGLGVADQYQGVRSVFEDWT